MIPWLIHYTGSDTGSGQAYLFWSGFGSDLGELVIVGGIITMVRHHNCHVKGCWLVGRKVEGTPYVACHNHHPDRQDNSAKRNVSHQEIIDHRASAQ